MLTSVVWQWLKLLALTVHSLSRMCLDFWGKMKGRKWFVPLIPKQKQNFYHSLVIQFPVFPKKNLKNLKRSGKVSFLFWCRCTKLRPQSSWSFQSWGSSVYTILYSKAKYRFWLRSPVLWMSTVLEESLLSFFSGARSDGTRQEGSYFLDPSF